MADDTLFDATDYTVVPAIDPSLSADRRRTLRQKRAIANGVHPLSLAVQNVRMHPDSDRTAAATDGKNLPLRCGSCLFRRPVHGEHNGTFPKCTWRDDNATDQRPRINEWPRVSNGAGTDVKAYWPACRDYSPGDTGLSVDAARYIPELAVS